MFFWMVGWGVGGLYFRSTLPTEITDVKVIIRILFLLVSANSN